MVGDFESEFRLLKLKMADKFFINQLIQTKLMYEGFYVRWLQILDLIHDLHVYERYLIIFKMLNSRWRTKFGKFQDGSSKIVKEILTK